jgi:hypothetical protein
MDHQEWKRLDAKLRQLLKQQHGEEAENLVSALSNESFAFLWKASVIDGRSVDILLFLWRRFNYRFQTSDFIDLSSQPGDTLLTLPGCTFLPSAALFANFNGGI